MSSSIKIYLEFLEAVLQQRFKNAFSNNQNKEEQKQIQFPNSELIDSPLAHFINGYLLTYEEVVVLMLALAPHLNPIFFDEIIHQYINNQGEFPQIGGARGKNHRGFIPTAETALFILADNDLEKRFLCEHIFSSMHLFAKLNVLWIEDTEPSDPWLSGKIVISTEYLEYFKTGKISHPRFSMEFPAQNITTQMEWDDLVLNEYTLKQINELKIWINHNETLMNNWGMAKKLKPGYRSLFHGPPGTGKTLTATLLGKYTGKDVFKIDLSMVVSKFVGETEKNLSNLFNKAENKNWILFFDEADALFSKRTNVRDAHDKYANQEAAYLLQRIENFNGLVILATNFKNNIDEAFTRRFHSIIHFPMPGEKERYSIWQKAFPSKIKLAENSDLKLISKKYTLSGSAIMNVVQYCCLQILEMKTTIMDQEIIIEGIRKEYLKEGKIW